MKLRYLHVRNNPPLQNVAVTFRHEEVVGRKCAIHYVVGVNGSGKSRMLYVLAEIFLQLSRNEVPAYPVTVAYDLGTGKLARTICLHSPTGFRRDAEFIEYQIVLPESFDWETVSQKDENLERKRYSQESFPSYLPSILVAHTSGATEEWERLFTQRDHDEKDAIQTALEGDDLEERPPEWDVQKEWATVATDLPVAGQPLEESPESIPPEITHNDFSFFIAPDELKLAALAVTLDQAVQEFPKLADKKAEKRFLKEISESLIEKKPMPGLRGILNAVEWLWPVSIVFRFNWEVTRDPQRFDRNQGQVLHKLHRLASCVLQEPRGSSSVRRLVFDVQAVPSLTVNDKKLFGNPSSTGVALLETLRGSETSPFAAFKLLRTWQRMGLLHEATMIVRRRNVDSLLLYDWLSDGERLFLGRMALFHLLKDNMAESLVLFDEPETHFNDVWKREIVDIIDESLGNIASNAVITTHSSIALTDAFDTEINLLKRNAEDGWVFAADADTESFGATPTEIMRDIFGAPSSVGQRAFRFLELVRTISAHPDEAEAIWELSGFGGLETNQNFQVIWKAVQKAPRCAGTNPDRLKQVLQALKAFALKTNPNQPKVAMAEVVQMLVDRVGSGYYQFELRRRLDFLKERKPNVAPNPTDETA